MLDPSPLRVAAPLFCCTQLHYCAPSVEQFPEPPTPWSGACLARPQGLRFPRRLPSALSRPGSVDRGPAVTASASRLQHKIAPEPVLHETQPALSAYPQFLRSLQSADHSVSSQPQQCCCVRPDEDRVDGRLRRRR